MRKWLTKTFIADLFHALQVVPSKWTLKLAAPQHGPRSGLNVVASSSVTVFSINFAVVMSFCIYVRILF